MTIPVATHRCWRCRYSFAGLTDGTERCPECGTLRTKTRSAFTSTLRILPLPGLCALLVAVWPLALMQATMPRGRWPRIDFSGMLVRPRYVHEEVRIAVLVAVMTAALAFCREFRRRPLRSLLCGTVGMTIAWALAVPGADRALLRSVEEGLHRQLATGAAAGLAFSFAMTVVQLCRRRGFERERIGLGEHITRGAQLLMLAILAIAAGAIVLPFMP